MAENRGFDILDYLVLIVKWKKALIILLISTLVISYLTIYFFVPEEFESTATVLPSGDSQLGGISGMMKSLKDLPLGLGGKSKNGETDLYLTIIYSRTSLENIIKKYDLLKEFNVKYMDDAVKILNKKISANLAEDNSFHISVRAGSAQKAADMVNYILQYLNETVINLNVAKSKTNREFLEKRYAEIKRELKYAEDSLQIFQQRSGILDPKEQPRLILDSFSKLENDMTAKQVELSIMEKIASKDSPQLNLLKTQLQEYQASFENLKKKGDSENILQPISGLPEKTKNFVRYFRNVEMYNAILEFIAPLYEQAKFEEQKDMPVLQIIDYGNVPQKRVAPQRTMLSIVVSILMMIIAVAVLILREVLRKSNNPKINIIKRELKFSGRNNSNLIGKI